MTCAIILFFVQLEHVLHLTPPKCRTCWRCTKNRIFILIGGVFATQPSDTRLPKDVPTHSARVFQASFGPIPEGKSK